MNIIRKKKFRESFMLIVVFITMAMFSIKIMVGMISLFEEIPIPNIINRGALLFYICLFLYFIFNHKFDKSFLGFGTLQFIICFIIIDFLLYLYNGGALYDYLYRDFPLVLSLITYIVSYNLYLKYPRDSILLQYVAIALVLILCAGYFVISNGIRFSLEHFSLRLGIAYIPLLFTPLLLLNKNKVSLICFLVVGYVVIDSGKRGGLIALLVGLVLFYLVIKQSISKTKNIRIILLLTLAILFIEAFLPENTIVTDMLDRLIHGSEDSDYSSGRVSIYTEVLNKYFNSDPVGLLFGHGLGSVDKISKEGLSAHNDFIEALFDFGFIGFVSYLMFYIYYLRQIFLTSKKDKYVEAVLTYSFLIVLFLSVFSQIFIYQYLCLFTFTWGAISGSLKQEVIRHHKLTLSAGCPTKLNCQ